MSVPDQLRKDLEWYIANQKDLAAQHNGKILLIVDQKLIDSFGSMEEAFAAAAKKYSPGTFTLQPCSPDSDSYTLTIYTPSFGLLA